MEKFKDKKKIMKTCLVTCGCKANLQNVKTYLSRQP